jgi:oligopeptide/dipeptide ABC transporter ATP-binding protein
MSFTDEKLIEVTDLKKYFGSGIFKKSRIKAVDGVSFEIGRRETFALIGESGCGKSTVGRCILGLVRPTEGHVFFKGMDISSMNEVPRDLRKKFQVIFQDADGTLNPRMRVFDLLMEPFRIHRMDNGQSKEKIAELIEMVNITPDLLGRYPHELSGGQRQRIGIARAIALNPEFIVADEPAASLDLSVQAQMLDLMKKFQAEHGIGYLYISHNLKIVKLMANRVAVMYLGKLVEVGGTDGIFNCAKHPYTQALISAIPVLDPRAGRKRILLEGDIPSPMNPPPGCRFHTRCPYREKRCMTEEPALVGDKHMVACHLK